MKQKLKITLASWYYQCGDGCCNNYGTNLYLNEKQLKHPDPEQYNNGYLGEDVKTALLAVLKELGYDVEFEEVYEE